MAEISDECQLPFSLSIYLTLEEDGYISFDWKVGTTNCFLPFSIDNNPVAYCTTTNWESVTFPVSAGSHSFVWELHPATQNPVERAWIDAVKVIQSGGFKYVNGTEGMGKVLVSDDSGNASWSNVNATSPVSGQLTGTIFIIPILACRDRNFFSSTEFDSSWLFKGYA